MEKITGYGGMVSFFGFTIPIEEWEVDFVAETPRACLPIDVEMMALRCKPPYTIRPRRLVGWLFPGRN